VLEEMPESTKVSWMLTVQHSLELAWANVFGPCVADAGSQECQDWQLAGTVDMCSKFAALHLAVVSQMAITDSTTVKMKGLLLDRANTLGKRYAPLLDSSYLHYAAWRQSLVQLSESRGTLYAERGCSWQTITAVSRDLFTAETLVAGSERLEWCGGNEPPVPAFVLLARSTHAQRMQDVSDGLQREIGQHIDRLVGSCRQPDEPCNYAVPVTTPAPAPVTTSAPIISTTNPPDTTTYSDFCRGPGC